MAVLLESGARGELDALSDAEVVDRVRGGERELFELLVRRHNQRLFRAARAILRDDADAEDVLQEAWVRAFAHLDQFRGDAQFATWVTRIAVYEALGRRRRRGRVVLMGTSSDLEGADSAMRSAQPGPERRAATAEVRRILETAIDSLPEPLRIAYVLREIDGLDTRDTAEALGLTEGAVKVRLHRARRELRQGLERSFDDAGRELYPFLGERCDRLTSAVMARIRGLQGSQAGTARETG